MVRRHGRLPVREPRTPPATRGGGGRRAPRGRRLTRRRTLALLAAIVLGAVWAVASYLLWDSHVPDDLVRPQVDVERLIDPATIDEAEDYERFFRIEFVVSQLVLIAVLLLYARFGIRFARESAAGRIGTGMLLGMIGLALVWLSQVPFRLAEVWWERRYDQTDSGYIESLFANWIALGAEFLFVSFALVVVMAIAGVAPRRWWLFAAPFFVGLAALFGFVYPYLSVTEPLEDAALSADARAYAEKQDRAGPDRGRGRDRLHELAERVRRRLRADEADRLLEHAARRPVDRRRRGARRARARARAPLAQPHPEGTRLVRPLRAAGRLADRGRDAATRRHGRPGRGPLSLLVLVLLDLLSTPVYNLVSRHMEEEADWVALETTRDRTGRRRSSRRSPSSRSTTRPAHLVVPALRQPPVDRAADRARRARGVTEPR